MSGRESAIWVVPQKLFAFVPIEKSIGMRAFFIANKEAGGSKDDTTGL